MIINNTAILCALLVLYFCVHYAGEKALDYIITLDHAYDPNEEHLNNSICMLLVLRYTTGAAFVLLAGIEVYYRFFR